VVPNEILVCRCGPYNELNVVKGQCVKSGVDYAINTCTSSMFNVCGPNPQ